METNTRQPNKRIGTNIRHMREKISDKEITKCPGRKSQGGCIKQDVLPSKLGLSQQKISKIEQNESIEAALIEQVAEALGITEEAIQNFDEEKVIYNIVTNNSDNTSVSGTNYHCTFNPHEKYVEAVDKIEKLDQDLLESEREKVALLKEQLGKK